MPVLTWIASREDCDAATAASIAWMADPAYHADTLRSGRTRLPSDEWDLLQLILGRFRRGAYRRTELGLFAGHEHQPARYLAALGGDPDPLDLPASFFAPASGRPPRVPHDCDAGRSTQVWDLLAALGTYAGRRPRSGRRPVRRRGGEHERGDVRDPPASLATRGRLCATSAGFTPEAARRPGRARFAKAGFRGITTAEPGPIPSLTV